MSVLKKYLALILLFFLLSGCSDLQTMLGFQAKNLDFPPGEYIGTAKLIIPWQDDLPEQAPAQPAPITPLAKLDDSNTPTETAEQGTEGNAEPAIKPFIDEYPPENPTIAYSKNLKPIKLSFLPKDSGLIDGVGILTFDNNSQKLFWRANGNNKDFWNLQFAKDNNLYTNLHSNMNFTGTVKASEIENFIEGKLHIDLDGTITEYFIQAYQYFKPEIIPPKEALKSAGGTNLDITVTKTGDDPENFRVLMISKTDKENKKPLDIASIKPAKEAGQKIISLVLEKEIAQGDYWLILERKNQDRRFSSNKIMLTIGK
jgi:hypothetical protein